MVRQLPPEPKRRCEEGDLDAYLLPAIKAVMDILKLMVSLSPEQIQEALDKIGKMDSTYGLLWGDLTMVGRRRDERFLKLIEVEKQVLTFIQQLQSDEKHWNMIRRVVFALKVEAMQKEAES